jgi:transcriptional regulator
MRHTPHYLLTDPDEVKRLIRRNAWATYVSNTSNGLVASHYPTLLEETDDDSIVIVSHFGRPDELAHELGQHEVMVIVAGPHGYISPSWYVEGATPAPTWNFSVAHCYGVPEILDPDENLRVLTRLVDHFERHVEHPLPLDQEIGARIARGTVGLRLPITRFVCKVKMSQDKDPVSQRRVLAELRGDGPYRSTALADDMERALARAATETGHKQI